MKLDDAYYKWCNPGWWENEEEKAQNMTVSELCYAREDSRQARDAMDDCLKKHPEDYNFKNSYGKYADQVHIICAELRNRRK